jgi:dTDP-4-dehydrorhamnose reductase
MKWLVVGANGMLGKDLVAVLNGQDFISLTKSDCDITNIDQVIKKVQNVDVVVNCAAYTKVDDAEVNTDLAFDINAKGPKNLAIACSEINAKLVQISTDYVFSGNAEKPYEEDEATDPKSIYGESKLAGEEAVKTYLPNNYYLVRTAWLYGKNGQNFGKTMLNLAKTKESINVVSDQIGQPTWTKDLAEKIVELISTNSNPGTYHGTSQGQTSWFGYAQKIFQLAGLDTSRIIPVGSSEFQRAATRPAYSVLSHGNFLAAGIAPIRNWEDALIEAFNLGVLSA